MPKTMSQQTVVRNEFGLSISGTRLTLYDIMDYVMANWPEKLIKDLFNLSDQEIADVMSYIEDNWDEVKAEYLEVLEYAAEERHYWEERNRERLAIIKAMPPSPGNEAVRAKLSARQESLEMP
jgi:uncharacterized protein (DUF433 family)